MCRKVASKQIRLVILSMVPTGTSAPASARPTATAPAAAAGRSTCAVARGRPCELRTRLERAARPPADAPAPPRSRRPGRRGGTRLRARTGRCPSRNRGSSAGRSARGEVWPRRQQVPTSRWAPARAAGRPAAREDNRPTPPGRLATDAPPGSVRPRVGAAHALVVVAPRSNKEL